MENEAKLDFPGFEFFLKVKIVPPVCEGLVEIGDPACIYTDVIGCKPPYEPVTRQIFVLGEADPREVINLVGEAEKVNRFLNIYCGFIGTIEQLRQCTKDYVLHDGAVSGPNPTPGLIYYSNRRDYVEIDFPKLHSVRGCKECPFADVEMIGKGACCTSLSHIEKDQNGKCEVPQEVKNNEHNNQQRQV